MKKINLTESQLHNVIKESVKSLLREWDDLNDDSYYSKSYIDDIHNINVYVGKALEAIDDGELVGGYVDSLYKYCQDFVEDYAQTLGLTNPKDYRSLSKITSDLYNSQDMYDYRKSKRNNRLG